MKCNLRKIRIRDNIFQSDLAKALNVNQNTISRWESMNRLPGLKKQYN